MANESTKWLYDQLKGKGYNVGKDVNEFDSLMRSNADSRKWAYETATKSGLNVGKDFDEFSTLVGGAQIEAPTAPSAPPAQKAEEKKDPWKLSPIQQAYALDQVRSSTDATQRMMKDAVENTERMARSFTQEGRDEQKAGEMAARMAGRYQKPLGLSPTVSNGEVESATGTRSQQSPTVNGVKMVDGELKTEYMLPDGSLTTDFTKADRAEYTARQARLQHQFEKRMEQNGLDPSKQEDIEKQKQRDLLDESEKRVALRLAENEANLRKISNRRGEEFDESTKWNDEEGFWDNMARIIGGSVRRGTDRQHPTNRPQESLMEDERNARTLTTENAVLNEAKNLLETRQLKKSKGFMGGFWNVGNNWRNMKMGARHTLGDVDLYSGGVMSLQKATQLLDMENKLKHGENLSDAEVSLLYSTMLGQDVAHNTDTPHGYNAAQITVEMFPFMAQMILNPASGLSEALVKKFGKSGVKKIAMTIAGDVAESAVLANTLQAPATIADAMSRYQGEATENYDENGNRVVSFDGSHNWGTAIGKAEGAAIIENYTEMLGEHFGAIKDFAGKWIGKGVGKLGGGKIVDAVTDMTTKIKTSDWGKAIGGLEKRAHWNGTVGEVLEEEAGIVLNSMFVGDNKFSDLVDADQQIDIVLGVGLFGGFVSGIKSIGYPISRARAKSGLRKADGVAGWRFGDEWESIRSEIDNAEESELAETVRNLASTHAKSQEQAHSIVDYARALMKARGMDIALATATAEGNVTPEQQDAEESFSHGESIAESGEPDAMRDVRTNLDRQRERLVSATSEEFVTEHFDNGNALDNLTAIEMDDDLRGIALDYINAQHIYEGLLQGVRDDIDGKIARSDAEIDGRTHRSTGLLIPATMRADERQVFVVSGFITTFDDGSGIDESNSDNSIIVRDAETGKLEFASPSQIKELGVSVNAEQEKAMAADLIRQETAQEASDAIEGRHTFNGGEIYLISYDNEGHEQFISILGPTIDENGQPIFGNIDVQMEDGTIQSIPTSTVEDWIRASEEQRASRYEEERDEEREAESTQIEDESPNPQPPILSDIPTESEPEAQNQTALERIDKDEQGTPLFESADPETAWDALVEDSEDETEAEEYATGMTKVLEKEAEKARKKFGNVKVTGDRAKYKADKEAARKELAEAEKRLAHWQAMLETKNRRQQEAQAAAEAEERRIAAERAERERLERERRDAEARAEAERLRQEKEERDGIPEMTHDTPEDARQRGKRRIGTTVYARQEPITEKVEGKEVTVDFNEKKEGHRPKGRLVVIEAAQGQASHMEGKRNPLFFIDEAQPKDRTDAESILAEQKHAREMDPSLITDSRDMVDPFRGAPTVNSRGEAIQGNHRMAALRYMYANEPEAQKRYRDYLYEHAAEFGFTPEQAQDIAFMEEPILVNMVDVDDAMAIELGQDTGNSRETGGKDRIDADRLAVGIGDKMGRFMDTLLTDDSEEGESLRSLIRRNGLAALKYLRDMGKIDDRQYATAINKDGNLSDEGLEDVEKFIKRTFFAGESREFEDMFDALPAKAQSAVLAQIWRDTKTAEADKAAPHVKEAVKAFYAMQSIPQFKEARTFKDALRAAEMWRAQTEFNEEGDIVSNQNRYSNFAIRLAAMMKGSSMKETRAILKQMLDWMQDSGEQTGLFDMMESEEETEQDRTFAGAVRKVLDLDYKAGESSPVMPEIRTEKAGKVLDDKESSDGEQTSETQPSPSLGQKIEEAEAEVNTNPTDPQKAAGNYKKGHVQVGTFDVTIENPKGSKRSGTDADGKKWETTMTHTYGYIRGTKGVDGDHIDVYISSEVDDWNGRNAFVVDQYNPDGSFDEHKVMLGFNDRDEAFAAYLSNYESGWEKGRRLDITAVPIDEFEKWIESSKRKTKPFADYKSVKTDENATATNKEPEAPAQEQTDNNSTENDNGENGGTDVAGNDQASPSGERGSRRNDRGGKRTEKGEGTTETGEGAGSIEQEKPSFLNAVRTLYEKGKEAASKLFQRTFFDVAETPAFMKELGLTGDKFTIRYGVISRHFGKDAEHTLSQEIWERIPKALSEPFAITRYYTDKEKKHQKGYRLYTTLQLPNGSYVVVSAEVRNAGRNIEVNAINTIFGRESLSETQDELIYTSEKITPEQQSLLDGNNPRQYPAGRKSLEDKQSAGGKSSTPRELTAADLDSIDPSVSGIDESVIGGARDYIEGERTPWSEMCYKTVKEYVRNTRDDRGTGSEDSDRAQLAESDAEPAGRGEGQEGSRSVGMDREDGRGDVSGSGESREDSTRSGGTLSGEEGTEGTEGATADVDTDNTDTGNTGRGGRAGGSRSNVRKPGGKKGSKRNARTDGSGDAEALESGTHGAEAPAQEQIKKTGEETAQGMIDDGLATIRDIFKNPGMSRPGQLNDVTTLLAGLGVNAARFLGATAKIGCGLVMKGYYRYARWQGEMHRNLDPLLTEYTDLTDEQTAEFIRSAWDMKMSYRGERKKISEWAAELEQEELRRLAQMGLAEKRKLQAQAEGTEVKPCDLDNIRETLPFLLPAQHEDVEKAEIQFFKPEHSDKDHGYGKGYLFTNGTGTGKTYTGLGIAKRFIKQGKGRILIVTVNDTKISDWIKDAKNLGIEATQLPDTKSKGKGVVVTQYANLRQNYALLEDEFDLIIYDESHKLMENQEGIAGSTADMHHMVAARDAEAVIRRRLETSELGRNLRESREEIKRLNEILNIINKPASLVTDKERDLVRNSGYQSEQQVQDALRAMGNLEERLNNEMESAVESAMADESQRAEAEEISKNTKTVFLSATPFNTPSSLDYAEGYIFSYPTENEGSTRQSRRNDFLRKNFGKSHRRNSQGNMTRMSEGQITDPEAVEEEEINFSNHLQEKLHTMSGRMLDSAYDYSRSFPRFDMPEAQLVNSAMSEISRGPLSKFFKRTLLDYNYSTAFWEIIKTGFALPRIREHIALGRKVVVFHRRKASNQEVNCPFATGISEALKSESDSDKAAAREFAIKYRELLAWEANLDYTYPQDRILNEFVTDEERAEHEKQMEVWRKKRDAAISAGKRIPPEPKLKSKRVGIFNGDQSAGEKQGAVDNFNLADSDQDVIVVQVQSGKEGISLHDTDGKHQRVMMSLALPQSPIEFIQAEGRIYRVGNQSDAIFEYPLLGIDRELFDFAMKINGRSQTSENLAMGAQSRGLRDSITRGALGSTQIPVAEGQGKGGKMLDSRQTQNATGFDHAMSNWKEWQEKEAGVPYDERSIPDPLGFKLMEWAGAERGETVLVGYAGEGSAARYAPSSTKLIALESDSGKLARLAALLGGGGRKILGDAFSSDSSDPSDSYSIVNKADIIVVKTKSGTYKDGFSTKKRSVRDVRKALQHTEDSGRIIAIVPTVDLKGIGGILNMLDDQRKFEGCVARTVINLPADIFGEESSIIVIDKNQEPTIAEAKAAQGLKIRNAKTGESVEETLSNLRNEEVEKREVDRIAKAVKRVKKVLGAFQNSKLVSTERWRGNNQKVANVTRYEAHVRFTKHIIPESADNLLRCWNGISLDFSKMGQRSYLEEVANYWAGCRKLSEMDLEEFKDLYEGKFRTDAQYQEALDLMGHVCTLIEAATGKTATQLSNIAEGKVENEIKKDMTLSEFQDIYKSLDSGSEELDALAERVFAVASQIEGLTFKMADGRVFSGHNVMAHYAPGKNAIELNSDVFNSIRTSDEQKAQCILHETIHAVTCWALARYKRASAEERKAMGAIAEACMDIEEVFKSINNDSFRAELQAKSKLGDNAMYGLTDEYEMLAEMANPAFRRALKAKRLWRQLVNGIKKLFGIDVLDTGEEGTTAFEVLSRAIETILNNFDSEAYAKYRSNPHMKEHEMRNLFDESPSTERRSWVQRSLFDESRAEDKDNSPYDKPADATEGNQSEEGSEARTEEVNARIDEFADRLSDIYGRYLNIETEDEERRELIEERMNDLISDELIRLRGHLEEYYLGEGNSNEDARRMARDMASRVLAEATLRLTPEDSRKVWNQWAKPNEATDRNTLITAGGETVEFNTATSTGILADRTPKDFRKLEPGEFCHVERKFTETKEFGFTGGEKIESLDDVAYIFRSLEDYSIENVFAVLVKEGRPVIVHLGMGGPSVSLADMSALRGALDAYGADEVYFVHNHPSGTLRPSPQDYQLASAMEQVVGYERFGDCIIIDVTSGRYSAFSTEMISGDYDEGQRNDNKERSEREYPVLRMNRAARSEEGKDIENQAIIRSAEDVARFVSEKRLGSVNKVNYLLLSHRNAIIGNLHSSHTDYKNDPEGLAEEMARMGVHYGASSVIPYGNVKMDRDAIMELRKSVYSLSGRSVRMLDAMEINSRIKDSYVSAQEMGMLSMEPTETTPLSKEELMRDGEGEYSDDEISLINDPWRNAWGKTLHHKKQRQAYAERQRNAMREKVRSLTEPYGIEVEIREDASGLEGKKRRAKGWFDPRTGKIVIVLGNHSSTADIQATLLHEMVAHKGLRDLFGDKFEAFLDAVYSNADNDVKERIDLLASQNGWNRRTATEEYMAGLAEDASFADIRSSWWQKLKGLFMDFLRSCGFSGNVKISDNELRYVLWMSWQNLKNSGAYHSFLGEAERVAKEYELKTGEYAETESKADEAAESDLRFRDGDFTVRDRKLARSVYEGMLAKGSWQFQEAVQDSMLGLKSLYEAVLTQGDPKKRKAFRIEDVAPHENAYIYENRMSSANNAEQHAYFSQYMEPLLKSIHAICGKDEDERRALTDYMMAKHGLERNEYMRNEAIANGEKADRDFAGLCGMTGEKDWKDAEAEAQKMVDEYEADHDMSLINQLWSDTKRATTATLEKIYLSGLISEDTYNKVLGMYDYYIPLRGWEETTSDEVYGYLTSKDGPLIGNVFKIAEGRESKADDPIATIAKMADDAIRQGNRNIMKQRFLNFVHGNPSDVVSVSQLWLQHNATKDEWEPVFADLEPDMTAAEIENELKLFEEKMESLAAADPDKYKRGRDARNIPYKVVGGNIDEHQVLVKRNGHTYIMTINGNPRAAQALNGLTNPDTDMGGVYGKLLKGASYVNRQLSAFYTTRNPDFVMSNFLRDMLYSNCMTWVKENPRYALRFHKNFGKVNPMVMTRLVYKWENGKLSDHNKTEKAFREFMLNGGETGYTSVRDIEQHKRAIAKEMKKLSGRGPKSWGPKAWRWLTEKLDLLNRSVENTARFAAFLTSREMGRSLDRSIYDAKEISVNFNKKGAGDRFVDAKGQTGLGKTGSYIGGAGRSLYVFWNAGVQGMTNFGRAGVRNPKKALTGAAALFTLGSVIPLLAQLLSGDGDDDDKNAYYNLPEYIRRSNICFKAGDQWITIPLPIEYRAIYGLGELATGVISGNERYSNSELTYYTAAQVSQILPLDFLEGANPTSHDGVTAGTLIHPFIPSFAKPFTEAYIMNRGWTGMPVSKDTPFNALDPEFKRVYQSTDQHLAEMSRWLNNATGGNDYRKGTIDINPAKIEYLLNGTFGGMFSFPMKIKKGLIETPFGDREFEWRNMPLANRVIKTGDERTENRKLQNEYYKYRAEAAKTEHEFKGFQKEGAKGIIEAARRADFIYNSDEFLRWQIADAFEPTLAALRKAGKEAPEKEKKQYQQEYYTRMRELVDALHNPKEYLKSIGASK